MKAVIVAGGEPHPADRAQLADANLLIAADAGAEWLLGLGIAPHLVIGDMDSIDARLLAELASRGVAVERHAIDKDASDLELAVDRAVMAGADDVVVIGAFGGDRLDHELANLLLAADPGWPPSLALSFVKGATWVRAVRGGADLELRGQVGDLVTLLPLSADAAGVRTRGLRYPLNGEPLRLGRSRGLSNVIDSPPALVSLEGGALLVIETGKESKG